VDIKFILTTPAKGDIIRAAPYFVVGGLDYQHTISI
jgi:hypothetical protein